MEGEAVLICAGLFQGKKETRGDDYLYSINHPI